MTSKDYLNPSAKALGFGAMRLPGEAENRKLVDAYLESGYNFFDTAWIYAGSEELLRKTLVKRHPRSSYVFANKLPPWEVRSKADRDKIFKEQLRRTGLDYFDFYLVHSLSDGRERDVEKFELFEYVSDLKKKGYIGHVGFSFHGSTAYLKRLLERHPEAEMALLQLNYVDILRGPAGEWHQLALEHNMPIFVMEPVKGGTLATLPPAAEAILKGHDPTRSIASWAIQYAAALKGVTCVLSGMSSLEQVRDNIKTLKNLKPLTEREMTILQDVLAEMSKTAQIPCTACRYCKCPLEIDIAACFSLYNELKRGGDGWNRSMVYKSLDKSAADCTECGACLSHCPQNIDIPRELKVVGKALN